MTKSWWDTVDILDRVVGSLVYDHPELEEIILKWSLSDNIWLRRVAIDHQLLRKEKTNVQLLEKILLHNLNQTEFFINKAIGWALRDYSKTNPTWVAGFIEKTRKEWLTLVSKKQASTSSVIEKRVHYLKTVAHLCYNRLYLKNFKEK